MSTRRLHYGNHQAGVTQDMTSAAYVRRHVTSHHAYGLFATTASKLLLENNTQAYMVIHKTPTYA